MISINRRALEITNEMATRTEELGIEISSLACGTRVIDIGLHATGGLLAGKYTAEISLGGMGEVEFTTLDYGDFWLPGVRVVVDRPEIGCMASQYAGWGINKWGFFAIGSGPARALARVDPVFSQLDYADSADVAVLILEGRQIPGDEIATYIAGKCRVEPASLTLILAPAACLAGSVQLSARVVATGMHKMVKLGFDVRKVLHGLGTCPIAPVVPDEDRASALSNDCVLYGGRVAYTLRADDSELQDLAGRIPSAASPDFGVPFYQLYQRFGSFYQMDPLIFCPSQVILNNLSSGRVYRSGRSNAKVLRESLLGENSETGL
ncbi:MAG TPA: methenyltetrahydromethanopterin cyclohydrolase [Anaerolineaceae bacterium]|nr:methenyltetrahydromethanopterin cyclohydrolase [Anaerolineaceae bacterium]